MKFPLIAAIALMPLAAWAQQPDPAEARLVQEWGAMGLAQQHVASAIQDWLNAGRKAQAEAEGRLKWVLDNWVPKPGKAE